MVIYGKQFNWVQIAGVPILFSFLMNYYARKRYGIREEGNKIDITKKS